MAEMQTPHKLDTSKVTVFDHVAGKIYQVAPVVWFKFGKRPL